MNLVIDAGNTFFKIGVFDRQRLVYVDHFSIDQVQLGIEHCFRNWEGISKAIVSSVIDFPKNLESYISNRCLLTFVSHAIRLPFQIAYKTPQTLGSDRIALVSGAVAKYPNEDLLIIGVGSCITYDFVNLEKTYFGGAISPGIIMRLKALNRFTYSLPFVELGQHEASLIGNSTENSIRSGILYGVVSEITGFVEQYNKKYPNLKAIITGGSLDILLKQLKNNIFVERTILLEGLDAILEYNN